MSKVSAADWTTFRVAELIEHKFTGPSPLCEERPIASNEEWGLLKTTAITWDGWNENAHKVPPKQYWGNKSIEVKEGDVLITKAGPRDRVGVVVHVAATRPHLMVSGKMVGLRPKTSKVVPRILADLLSTQYAQDYLNSRTTGMAESQTNFADEALLHTQLHVPPLPEQRVIANVLGAIDDQIRTTAQMIAKLRFAKQGQLEDFFSDLPATDNQPLSDLVTADICYGIVQSGPFVRDGVPVLTIRDLLGDFTSGIHRTSPAIERQYTRSRTQAGDVLISIKGTIGRVAIVPQHFSGNISRDMARIRLSRKILPEFIRQYFLSEIGRRRLDLAVVGTTRAEVSIHVLKKLRVPVMSHGRQEDVVDSLEAFDSRILSLELKLSKLHSLKRGLAADLLTGRVRVPARARL